MRPIFKTFIKTFINPISKKYKIIHIIILFIILGLIGYIIWNYIKNTYSVYEGARTLPRPTRHPLNQNDWATPVNLSYPGQTMNQVVDAFIAQYFDNNRLPYMNTADTYVAYVLGTGTTPPGKGDVKLETKRRMTDIGYYILEMAMPNIPTDSNPNPTASWPAIKWTNNSPFPLSIPDLTYMTYSNTWITDQWQLNGQSVASVTTLEDQQLANGTPGSGTGNGSSGDTSCYNQNNTCGNICPNSCFASAIASSSTYGSGNGTDGGSGSNNGLGGGGAFSGNLQEWTQIATPHTSTVTIGNSTFPYFITDMSQNNPTSTILDASINAIIDQYFDTKTNFPTPYAISQFNQFLSGGAPMDLSHKNKLRDVVYYFMEVIIPGLPNAQNPSRPSTSTSSTTYVEWKPIQWLSHSDL